MYLSPLALVFLYFLITSWIRDELRLALQHAPAAAPAKTASPALLLPAPVKLMPEEAMPLLPWEPKTPQGLDYRARQLAYRRANGLPLDR